MKEQDRIKENASWNQFWTTGSVADYLHYVADHNEAGHLDSTKMQRLGDRPHAGVDRGNRNHTETDAYR